jgi:hypothetical protein
VSDYDYLKASDFSGAKRKKYLAALQSKMMNEEFVLIRGDKQVKLVYDAHLGDLKPRELEAYQFETQRGATVRLRDIVRVPELGGKRVNHKESKTIAHLRKQMEEIREATGRGYVSLRVENKIHRVVEMEKPSFEPKADVEFMTADGAPSLWVSLKSGNSPTQMLQWSGVTEKAGEYFASHPEVKAFVEAVRQKRPLGMHAGEGRMWRPIHSDSLAKKAVYGPKYGSSQRSQDNVHTVLQGNAADVEIVSSGSVYTFNARHVYENGDPVPGDYEPVLLVRYASASNNFGIKGARFGIFPLGYEKRDDKVEQI